jgi:hypothetical protein
LGKQKHYHRDSAHVPMAAIATLPLPSAQPLPLKGPRSIWFYAAILFAPISIWFIVAAPLNPQSDLSALLGIFFLVKAVRLASQKVIPTEDALVIKTFSQVKSIPWLDVQSLRFVTSHQKFSDYGLTIFVEAPHSVFHFIVTPEAAGSAKATFIAQCKNAVIIDQDNGLLSPPKNPAARSHERLRRYAWGMILRRTIPNTHGMAVLIFILAAFGMDLSQRHNIPKSIVVPLITIVGVIAFTIFAVNQYRFARRMLR